MEYNYSVQASYYDLSSLSFESDVRVSFPVTIHPYLYLLLIPVVISLAFIVYNRFFHPLAQYPGPFWWTVARLPFVISIARGHYAHDMKRFHDKYGTVVRVAPNELSFIDSRAWKDIYGYHKDGVEFTKNPIWAHPTPNGVKSILSADQADHKRMRKLLLPAFSMRAIRESEAIIQHYIDNLLDHLRQQLENGSAIVDIKNYYSWTTFDMIGDLGFGEPFDCLKYESYHFWVSFLFSHLKAGALRACANYYPPIASMITAITPSSAFEEAVKHHNMSSEKLSRRLPQGTDRKDLLSFILEENKNRSMTIPELEATSAALILAGSEGVSTCLIATTNFLLRTPEKLEKLIHEVRTSFKDESEITVDSVEHLPYLKAVIQEGLRMAPPVPIGIPRIVPPSGRVVAGDFVPGNTFISVPQLAAYRYEGHFSYPNHFLPERWLGIDSELCRRSKSDPAFTPETFEFDDKKVVQPFSVGPRDCAGKTLAFAEMKTILARLLWNFNLNIPDERDAQAKGYRFLPFETQRTFALWERRPSPVHISLAKR